MDLPYRHVLPSPPSKLRRREKLFYGDEDNGSDVSSTLSESADGQDDEQCQSSREDGEPDNELLEEQARLEEAYSD